MRNLLVVMVAVMTLMLSGCVTVNSSKNLVLPASDKPVAVTASSQAKCYDLFFILTCKLYTKLEATNGQVVSDFPAN